MILTMALSLTLLGQVVLPGSTMSLQEAQAKARIIVVAELNPFGGALGSGGKLWYALELKHSAVLKGEVAKETPMRAGGSASGSEVIPEMDQEYIFFIDYRLDHPTVLDILKVLPKTQENVASVMEEIKAKHIRNF